MSVTTEGKALDALAEYIFRKTIKDGTAGDLLYRLFDGDGVTVDMETKELIFLPSSMFASMTNTDTEQEISI